MAEVDIVVPVTPTPTATIPIFEKRYATVNNSSSKKRSSDAITVTTTDEEDPLLCPDSKRYALFPIKYDEVWDMYQNHVDSFWTVGEIKLAEDLVDWETKLTDNERHFVTCVLAFFANSDGIVNENLATRFMKEVQIAEAKCFYGQQLAMENIHSHTYSLLIETFIKDTAMKSKLFNAVNEVPCVKRKAQWALKWINDSDDFGERLIAFAAVEGIFFSGSFCAIFWLKKRGLMPGLGHSNELISRDEALHCDFALLLFWMLKRKPTQETILRIITDAVLCEEEFITDALPVSLIGMNAETMTEYIHYIADRLLVCLGCKKHYNAMNPYGFMELQSLPGKTNFFEKQVSEYKKVKVQSQGALTRQFSTDSEF